jgi:hypothetical protein
MCGKRQKLFPGGSVCCQKENRMSSPQGPWQYPSSRYYYEWYATAPASRPDKDVKAEVVDRLRVNTYTSASTLNVDVKAGVVILTGDVPTVLAKRAAGDDVWDTPGVVDVSNQIRVVPAS